MISDATALGLGGGGQQDIKKIDGNFDLGAPTVETTEAQPPIANQPKEEKPATAGPGRVKGWKERLQKMREMKEKQEEEKANKSNVLSTSLTQSQEVDESMDSIRDIFAPAKGLEKNKFGKIAVNKDVVEKKEEPVFEKKVENLVADELKKSVVSSKAGSSTQSSAGEATKTSPSKTNRLGQREPLSATKRPGAKEETKAAGGLRGPSRLTKPSNLKPSTEADKKKEALLAKQ